MFNFDPMIVQAEIDYRTSRLRRGKSVKRSDRTRVPFVVRDEELSRRAR